MHKMYMMCMKLHFTQGDIESILESCISKLHCCLANNTKTINTSTNCFSSTNTLLINPFKNNRMILF